MGLIGKTSEDQKAPACVPLREVFRPNYVWRTGYRTFAFYYRTFKKRICTVITMFPQKPESAFHLHHEQQQQQQCRPPADPCVQCQHHYHYYRLYYRHQQHTHCCHQQQQPAAVGGQQSVQVGMSCFWRQGSVHRAENHPRPLPLQINIFSILQRSVFWIRIRFIRVRIQPKFSMRIRNPDPHFKC